MKRSGAWWFVVPVVVVLDAALALTHVGTSRSTGMTVAATLGYMVGVALIPTLVAAVTRFQRPWAVLVAFGVCFLAVSLTGVSSPGPTYNAQQTSNMPSSAIVAADRSHATQVDPVAEKARWSRDANFFTAFHPDLRYGSNMSIMQSKINEIWNPTLDNRNVLNEAYDLARRNPQWTARSHDPQSSTQ